MVDFTPHRWVNIDNYRFSLNLITGYLFLFAVPGSQTRPVTIHEGSFACESTSIRMVIFYNGVPFGVIPLSSDTYGKS